ACTQSSSVCRRGLGSAGVMPATEKPSSRARSLMRSLRLLMLADPCQLVPRNVMHVAKARYEPPALDFQPVQVEISHLEQPLALRELLLIHVPRCGIFHATAFEPAHRPLQRDALQFGGVQPRLVRLL